MTKGLIKKGSFCALISIALSFGYADVNSNITDLIKLRTNQDFVVKSIHGLSEKGLNIAILQDKNARTLVPVIVDSTGNTLFLLNNVYFAKNDDDAKTIAKVLSDVQGINANAKNAKQLDEMFAKVPSEYKITLNSTSKTPADKTIYIVSDPSCPHCQAELRNIDDRLKEGNVTMVLVSFLGENSKSKAGYILDNIKGKSTNDAKLKIIREAYNPSFRPKKVSDDNRNLVGNVTKEIGDVGIVRGVPFIYETLN
ncbi:MAG: disulfide isomerase [Helicobacter sp.]|nr:disulfide isomerase [Helicobacter sp.]